MGYGAAAGLGAIGSAIGNAAANATTAAATAAESTVVGGTTILTAAGPAAANAMLPVAIPMMTGIAGVAGAIAGPTLGNVVQGRLQDAAFAQVARNLSGLPDYERTRENLVLQALSQVADDPNRTRHPRTNPTGACYWPEKYEIDGDPLDSNGNGDKEESVPCLQHWLAMRAAAFHEHLIAMNQRELILREFLDSKTGTLKRFRDEVKAFLPNLERGIGSNPPNGDAGVECSCTRPYVVPRGPRAGQSWSQTPGFHIHEGTVIALWRDLSSSRPGRLFNNIDAFWKPGPTKAAVEGEANRNCRDDPGSCGTGTRPDGWDNVDEARDILERFVVWADGMIWDPDMQGQQMTEHQWIKGLAEGFDEWSHQLYWDPNDADYIPDKDASFFRSLRTVVPEIPEDNFPGIRGWITKTADLLKDALPNCNLAYAPFIPYDPVSALGAPLVCKNNEPPPPVAGYDNRKPPIFNCTSGYVNQDIATGSHLRDATFTNPALNVQDNIPPGPACKINKAHKTRLNSQITTVSTFVTNLPGYIPGQHLAVTAPDPVSAVCPPPCDAGRWGCPPHVSNCYSKEFGGRPYALEACPRIGGDAITQVCLDKETNQGTKDDLDYTFWYKFQCQDCFKYPLDSTDPNTVWVEQCSGPYDGWAEATKTKQDVGAPNLHIMCLAYRPFLDVAIKNLRDTMKPKTGTILDESEKPVCNAYPFGTNDADTEDEFKLEFDHLMRLANPIPSCPQSLSIFLHSVVEPFMARMKQAQVMAIMKPAKDGRLPNPEQSFKTTDPITGRPYAELFGKDFKSAGGFTRSPLTGEIMVNGVYQWKDSHGNHQVELGTGPWKMPGTVREHYGNWVVGDSCLELRDYCDGLPAGSPNDPPPAFDQGHMNQCKYSDRNISGTPASNACVRLERADPAQQATRFWMWNPFSNITWGDQPMTLVVKRARTRYSAELVELQDTGGLCNGQ